MRNKILALILALAGLGLAAPSKVHAQAASVGPIGGGGGGGGGDAQTADPLSQFAATSCAQFASVITGETGSCGSVVLSSGPRFGSTVTFGTASSNTGIVRLEHAGHAFFNAFQQSATQAEDITYTLPTTNGGVSEFLQSNGSGVLTWAAGGSGITVGTTTITSGTDTRVPYNDGGVYGEDAGLTWADATDILTMLGGATIGSVTTAARAKHQFLDTITGSSGNFYNVTGSFPGTLSASTNGVVSTFAVDNDGFVQTGWQLGLTGTGPAAATVYGLHSNNQESSSTVSIALRGFTSGAVNRGVGVQGITANATNGIGGFFGLGDLSIPSTTSAIVADNGVVAANIFEARDNGTAVLTVADGGLTTFASGLTSNGTTTFSTNTILGGDTRFYIGGLSANNSQLASYTAMTPDALEIMTGSASNSVHIHEGSDVTYDFQNPCTTGLGTSACTDPTLIVHSHNQDTGEFLSMAHDAKAAVIVGGNSTVLNGTLRLGGSVTLTESSATSVLTVPVAVSTGTGGQIQYTVVAKDATDVQTRTGTILYAVANTSGGTETCNAFGISTTQGVAGDTTNAANPTEIQDGSGVGAITSGTLTYAWSVDTSGSNSCVLKLNAVSSLTQTTFTVNYTVIQSGPGVPTGG